MTLAIAAGKGGVGKSMVSAYLAYTFSKLGLKVGLLDADIYGPSQGHILQLQGKPELGGDNKIIPFDVKGIKAISISTMIEPGAAVIWRGPMVQKAVDQFVHGVNWGDIDLLILDLPPGTGDIQLSIMQQAMLSAALLVTTPQDIALMDVQRAKGMFDRLNVPVLGVIENMGTFTCPSCKENHIIFPKGKLTLGVPLLGSLPLSAAIQESCAGGQVLESLSDPDLWSLFKTIGTDVLDKLKTLEAGSRIKHTV